jgi:hypothetical protein
MIRMQKLRELCSKACDSRGASMEDVSSEVLTALEYLRNQVAPVVNHENEAESKEFHQMCANLCLLETMMDEDEDRYSLMPDMIKSEGKDC